jgi:hypothetical protein
MFVRRLSIAAGTAAAMVVLSSGSAFAHYCFFNDPNVNANANRAGSSAFMSFDEYADFTGLCQEGKQVLAEAGGITLDTLINARGSMAGPTGGNKPIGHLDFGAVIGAGEDAFGACGMDVPDWWYEG